MLNKSFFRAAIAASAVMLYMIPYAAEAGTVVYNSLPSASAGYDLVNPIANGGGGPVGISFTATAGGRLQDVTLSLLRTDPQSTGSLSVNLYFDSGSNTTGAFIQNIGTLLDSSLTAGPSNYSFTSFASVSLTSGQRYWVNVLGTADSSAAWSVTTDTSGTGVNGEYAQSYNVVFPTSSGATYQAQITVPEPGTIALMSLGLVGFAFGQRRNKLS
jgi:hypothetical protein